MFNNGVPFLGSDWAKWFVVFAFILLLSLGVLVVLATGAFSPREQAIADGIRVQNNLGQKRGEIDLQYYAPLKQAEYQTQIGELAEKQRLVRAQNDQKLDQAERDFVQNAMLKEWGIRVTAVGVIAVLTILALGVTARLVLSGWAAAVQANNIQQATTANEAVAQTRAMLETLGSELGQMQVIVAQLTHQAQTDNQRIAFLLKSLGELNTRLDTLQHDSTQAREGIAQFAAQVMAMRTELVELQERGNGSGAGAEPHTGDKVIRFKHAA